MTESARRLVIALLVVATVVQIIVAIRDGVLWPVERWFGAW